jgi:hypothetical protein
MKSFPASGNWKIARQLLINAATGQVKPDQNHMSGNATNQESWIPCYKNAGTSQCDSSSAREGL